MRGMYLNKFFVYLVIFFFSVTNLSAAPRNIYKINLPDEYGSVKERYQGKTENVLIHIQDAHTSYSAQKNIAGILRYFSKNGVSADVMTEGASDNLLDYSFLRRIPDLPQKDKILSNLLRDGTVTGVEAGAAIVKNINIYGAEDLTYYGKNFKAFLSNVEKREEILTQIEAVEEILNSLKDSSLSDEIKKFEDTVLKYKKSIGIDFFKYCSVIISSAINSGIDISEYINLTMLLEAKAWEQNIDFKAVNSEREYALSEIRNYLSGDDSPLGRKKLSILDKKSSEYKEGSFDAEYYNLIKNLSREAGVDEKKIKNFLNFSVYISFFSRVDKAGLIHECEEIIPAIENKMAVNENERELLRNLKNIEILKRIVSLEALPEDIEYYMANRRFFSSAVIGKYLADNGYSGISTAMFDKVLPVVEDFYKYAEIRSMIMAKNSFSRMKRLGENIILVAGGYHSGGITEELKKNNVSYIVVMPKLEEDDAVVPYLEKMVSPESNFNFMINSAVNTLMQKAKALFSDKYKDMLGFEITDNMKNLMIIEKGGLASIDEKALLPLENALLAYMKRLGIESYVSEEYLLNDNSGLIEKISVNGKPFYILIDKNGNFKEISPDKFSEYKRNNKISLPVRGMDYKKLYMMIMKPYFDNLKIGESVADMDAGDFASYLFSITEIDNEFAHITLGALGDDESKNNLLKEISDTVTVKTPYGKINIKAKDSGKSGSMLAMLNKKEGVLRRVNELLVKNNITLNLFDEDFYKGVSSKGIFYDSLGNRHYFKDIVAFNDGKGSVGLFFDDFVSLLNMDEVFRYYDYQKGKYVEKGGDELIVDILRHESETVKNENDGALSSYESEALSRGSAPVSHADTAVNGLRLLRSGILDRGKLGEFTEIVENGREVYERPVRSSLSLYITNDYLNYGYSEKEMLNMLAAQIEISGTERVIIGLPDNADETLLNFAGRFKDYLKKDVIIVKGKDNFVSKVYGDDASRKIVVADEDSGVLDISFDGAGAEVVKIDISVSDELGNKTVVPASFAVFSSVLLSSKEELGANEGFLEAKKYLTNEKLYKFKREVVSIIEGLDAGGVSVLFAGIMKSILERITEEKIYAETVRIAA